MAVGNKNNRHKIFLKNLKKYENIYLQDINLVIV